jgi:hypothetical protein
MRKENSNTNGEKVLYNLTEKITCSCIPNIHCTVLYTVIKQTIAFSSIRFCPNEPDIEPGPHINGICFAGFFSSMLTVLLHSGMIPDF